MLATSKQFFNPIEQQSDQNEKNNNMNKETTQINKNINSPEYNDYLNYSLDSPMATDSSTTPFSNNETANTNNSSLSSSSTNKNININNININSDNDNNDTSENKSSPTDNLIHVDSIVSTSNDYHINTPSISSPSLSSSTTKLNTANNSMNNLSKLNFRLNYITSHPNNDVNVAKLPSASSSSSSNPLNATHPNAISDGLMAMEESPINNFSSPSVMNDLLDLLDAKETEKQQQQQQQIQTHSTNKLFSPLQLINKITQSPSFIDDDSINNGSNQQHSNLPTLDENFSPHQYQTKDRRSSMVVNHNNIFPTFTDTRNSISHGVDFWNLNDDKSLENDPISIRIDNNNNNNNNNDDDDDHMDPTATTTNVANSNDINLEDPAMLQSLDNTVSQVLNEYNMDFFKNNENSNISNNNNNTTTTTTNNTTTTDFNNFLYSPKQDVSRRQRSSMPSMSNRSIIDTLYENVTLNNPENNNAIKTPENNYKFGFDDENALLSDFDADDISMTPFKHNNTPTINNYGNNSNNNNHSNNNNTEVLPNNVDDILNQLNDPSKETKFIKPSMMLSKKASMAAKLATKGLPRLDTFPTIDFQPYNHPTRISKRKSVSSVTPNGSNIHKNSFNSARRKSIIGVVRSSPSMTPNTPPSSTPTTATTSSQSKGNSLSSSSGPSTVNFDSLEDKPFQCADCPKAFKRSEHLKRHVRSVHSNERPFACTLCEKKFSRSDNLSQHLKTHKKHGDL